MDEGIGGFEMGTIQMKVVPSLIVEKMVVVVSEDKKYLDKDGVANELKMYVQWLLCILEINVQMHPNNISFPFCM
jgi:hypothetical protein